MDHSYSTDRDSSRERERLHRQDHCYFAIADKTPLVVQRKVQQLQLTTSASSGGREDHTYGRQASLDVKGAQGGANVPALKPAGKENSTVTGHNSGSQATESNLPPSTSKESSPQKTEQLDQDSSHTPRQDHTYFGAEGYKPTRKKAADTSRYDHVYCSATQAADYNVDGHSVIAERQSDIQSSGSDSDDSSDISSDISSADSVDYHGRNSPQLTPSVELCDSLQNLDNRQPHIIGTVEVKTEDTSEDLACHFPLANLSVTEAATPVQSCRMPLMPIIGATETQSSSNRRSLELITADHDYHSVR